ncbi:MAG: flavodoxin family protein, partial [Clostridiales bacterium]
MNILLLNGSPREKGNTKAALTMLEAILPADAKVEMVNVPGLHLGGCKSCFACRKNGGTCVQPDGGAELLAKIAAADVVVFASPVYFMGISAQLKAVIDRFFSQVDAYKAATKKV